MQNAVSMRVWNTSEFVDTPASATVGVGCDAIEARAYRETFHNQEGSAECEETTTTTTLVTTTVTKTTTATTATRSTPTTTTTTSSTAYGVSVTLCNHSRYLYTSHDIVLPTTGPTASST